MLIYMLLALFTGMLLTFSTTMNGMLARRIGVLPGTLVNYLTGLGTSLVCVLLFGAFSFGNAAGLPWFALMGGVLGVMIIAITNVVLPHVPLVLTTVLLFAGQLAGGLVIDLMGGIPLTPGKVGGGLLIAGGIAFNVFSDRKK